MTEQTVNIPLLRKAVEWAEAEAAKPWELSEWTQNFYKITAASVYPTDTEIKTGWAQDEEQAKATTCGTCYCIAGYVAFEQAAITSVKPSDAADVAKAALNISGNQAEALFHWGNTIEDVREIAESIAGERL